MTSSRVDRGDRSIRHYRRSARLAWTVAGVSVAVALLLVCVCLALLNPARPVAAGSTGVSTGVSTALATPGASPVQGSAKGDQAVRIALAESFARGYSGNVRYSNGICPAGDWFGWDAGTVRPRYTPFAQVRILSGKSASGPDDAYWVYEIVGKDRRGKAQQMAVVLDVTGPRACVASVSSN